MNSRLFIICILLLSARYLHGQFFETGQPPASVRWEQINTDNFRIIYPATFGNHAHRLASLLEEARYLTGYSLDHDPRKIPVLVHNHNARSNGLVSWAPRRMELYPVPPQDARSSEWLLHLAVHEQRHVVQIDRLNRGTTRALSLLLGEQAHGLGAGRLPLWFLEGDAVAAETDLTLAGRGRAASFDMPLRALLLSKPGQYSYDKFLFRSFKDHVPDHYTYGYQVVGGLRAEFGPEIWTSTLEYLARRPYHPAPFATSVKRQTGTDLPGLNEKTLDRLRNEWVTEHEVYMVEESRSINHRDSELFTSYRHPLWIDDSAVIALKSGIAQTNEFVVVNMDGTEKPLHSPGILSSPSFTFRGSRLAWSEFQPDIRWGLQSYSVIRVLDTATGRGWRIGNGSRYFSPVFAPDGLFLGAVEIDLQNRHFLVFINSVTGEVAGRHPAPGDVAIQVPAIDPSGRQVFMTFTSREGMGITMFDRDNGRWETVLEPSFVNISSVFTAGRYICFRSDHAGKDDLFALDRYSRGLYRLTSSRFGAFDGSFSTGSDQLVYSDYSAYGYNLVTARFDPVETGAGKLQDPCAGTLPYLLASHEKGKMSGAVHDSSIWQSAPYRKGLNLFRFHSWSPFYYDYSDLNIEGQSVYPGVSILSQNLLNTAKTFIGYSYRGGRHVTHGNLIYKGWYPVLEAGFDYGDEPLVFTGRDTLGPQNGISYGRLNLKGAAYLPLNLSSGRYVGRLEPWMRISYRNDLYHYEEEDLYKKGMTTIETMLLAYRYRRRSYRDIAPPWGQVFRWRRIGSPFESENLGTINAVEVTFWFPGLMPHHSIRLDAAGQAQDPVKYYYTGVVSFPPGYEREKSDRLRLISGKYSFPFLYPDLSLPGVLYLKRLHAGVFAGGGVNSLRGYNATTRRIEWQDERLFSYGADITASFHLFRLVFPFNMSIGFAHIPEREKISLLFSMSMDINIF